MGILSSKQWEELLQESPKEDICTPETKPLRVLQIDPRSPTNNIDRTPIQVEQTPQRFKAKYIRIPDSGNDGLLSSTPTSATADKNNELNGNGYKDNESSELYSDTSSNNITGDQTPNS